MAIPGFTRADESTERRRIRFPVRSWPRSTRRSRKRSTCAANAASAVRDMPVKRPAYSSPAPGPTPWLNARVLKPGASGLRQFERADGIVGGRVTRDLHPRAIRSAATTCCECHPPGANVPARNAASARSRAEEFVALRMEFAPRRYPRAATRRITPQVQTPARRGGRPGRLEAQRQRGVCRRDDPHGLSAWVWNRCRRRGRATQSPRWSAAQRQFEHVTVRVDAEEDQVRRQQRQPEQPEQIGEHDTLLRAGGGGGREKR